MDVYFLHSFSLSTQSSVSLSCVTFFLEPFYIRHQVFRYRFSRVTSPYRGDDTCWTGCWLRAVTRKRVLGCCSRWDCFFCFFCKDACKEVLTMVFPLFFLCWIQLTSSKTQLLLRPIEEDDGFALFYCCIWDEGAGRQAGDLNCFDRECSSVE